MTLIVKNLGIVKAMHVGATAPTNTQMMWYDTGANLHKYYNVGSTSWVTFAAAASALTQVLAAGNTTGGQNIVISSGDRLRFSIGGFNADAIPAPGITANREYQLPNASGTIALTSNITPFNLSSTLAAGNTTGANDVSVDDGRVIKATNGDSSLNLRFGGNGVARLGNVDGYLITRKVGEFEAKAQNGLFKMVGTNISLYAGTTLKGSFSQIADDLYFSNATTAKNIYFQVAGTTTLQTNATATYIPKNMKLGVGSSVTPIDELELGDGTYRANMTLRGDALGVGNTNSQSIKWTAGGTTTTEIMRDFTGGMHIINHYQERMRFFVKDGASNVEYMQFNPNASSSGSKIVLSERTSIKSLKLVGNTQTSGASIDVGQNSLLQLNPSANFTCNNLTNPSSHGGLLIVLNTHTTNTVTLTHNNGGVGQMRMANGTNTVLQPKQGIIFHWDAGINGWIEIAH